MKVVTFDEYGVSGHANHIATYHGVCLALSCIDPAVNSIIGYKLITTNTCRKFIGLFDIILSCLIFPYHDLIVYNFNLITVMMGLWSHKSQMVWYRIIFIILSRYTYVNTFSIINPK